MAERKVSTRLVLEGEKEYRAQVSGINSELRSLNSAIKLVDSQFHGQQNTLAALQAKHKALNDVLAAQGEKLKAENTALEKVRGNQAQAAAAAEAVKSKMVALNETTDDAQKETEEYAKQMAALQKEYDAAKAAEEQATQAVNDHTRKANEAQVQLNTLNRELASNEKYLDEAKASADGCATSIDGMGKAAGESSGQMGKFAQSSAAGIDMLAEALQRAGVQKTLEEIAQALWDCMSASVGFESGMAGVAKTTDMTDDELAAMGQSVREMADWIPLLHRELTGIAETGGQLGIANRDLVSFTEVMAQLGTATNMTSEEAATMLAQFANITGMDASLYENLGSAIVDLGNNFATNERKITDMSQSIAAAGTNAGMSAPDLLALSASVTSLGIQADAGGTSMSSLIGAMQKAVESGEDLDEWAKVAGMSAREFAALWGSNATEALTRFIQGLGTTDQSVTMVLDSLGITETRLTRMVTSLNKAESANGLLSRALKTSNDAWAEGNALAQEAATRYETTESKQALLTNGLENLKIAVGDQLKPALQGALEAGTDLAKWAEEFVRQNQALVPIITSVVTTIGAFVGAITLARSAVFLFKAAMDLLNATMATSPWTVAIAAIAALAAGVTMLVSTLQLGSEETQKWAEANRELSESIEQTNAAYEESAAKVEATSGMVDELCAKLDLLGEKSSLTAGEQQAYARIVDQLNQLMPALNLEIDAQTGKLTTNTTAIRDQTAAWKEQQVAEAAMERRKKLVDLLLEAQTELGMAELQAAERSQELARLEANRANVYDELLGKLGKTREEWAAMSAQEGAQLLQGLASQDEAAAKLIGTYNAYNVSIAELQTQNADAANGMNTLAQNVEAAQKTLDDYDQITGKAADSTNELAQAQDEVDEKAAKSHTAYMSIIQDLQELSEAYEKAQEANRAQVDSTFGMFEDIKPAYEQSIEDTKAMLDSQYAYWANYGSLVQQLIDLDINPEILAAWADLSPESAAIFQGMIDSGEAGVAEINGKWENLSGAKDTMARIMTELQTDLKEKTDQITADVETAVKDLNQEDAAKLSGDATAGGYLDALEEWEPRIRSWFDRVNSWTIKPKPIPNPFYSVGNNQNVESSHAAGLDYVPYDNYLALLHKGERVQTAMEARAQRAQDYANYGIAQRMLNAVTTNQSLQINVTIQGGATEDTGRQVAEQIDRELRYRGVML